LPGRRTGISNWSYAAGRGPDADDATALRPQPGRTTVAGSTRQPAATRPVDPNRSDPATRNFRRLDDVDPGPVYEDEEIRYGQVLFYAALWYAVPGFLYLLWTVTLSGYRRTMVLHNFGSGLPWLTAAIALSLVVAAILRWAVIGWRPVTISFAGAVIGAGVATIAHSLVL
jgi:hypothetical protein